MNRKNMFDFFVKGLLTTRLKLLRIPQIGVRFHFNRSREYFESIFSNFRWKFGGVIIGFCIGCATLKFLDLRRPTLILANNIVKAAEVILFIHLVQYCTVLVLSVLYRYCTYLCTG